MKNKQNCLKVRGGSSKSLEPPMDHPATGDMDYQSELLRPNQNQAKYIDLTEECRMHPDKEQIILTWWAVQ